LQKLYQRLRNQIHPWKNKDFLTFIREEYSDKDPHHLLGSLGSMKISDSLIAPLNRVEHNKADKQREEYFELYLPFAINILQRYIDNLQTRIKELENGPNTKT